MEDILWSNILCVWFKGSHVLFLNFFFIFVNFFLLHQGRIPNFSPEWSAVSVRLITANHGDSRRYGSRGHSPICRSLTTINIDHPYQKGLSGTRELRLLNSGKRETTGNHKQRIEKIPFKKKVWGNCCLFSIFGEFFSILHVQFLWKIFM